MVPDQTMSNASPLTAAQLRERFDATEPLTIGLEEEAMLLDPRTLDLAPRATEVLGLTAGDGRFKPELPAAHLELMTEPHASPAAAVAELAGARRDLVALVRDDLRVAAAGVHPFAAAEGVLNSSARYDRMPRDYGWIAERQLVASLQVHIAVGGAERTLAVYNALRSYLPEIAALAANAAFYEGRDSGMASVRPLVCTLLPRQGVPPAFGSWDEFAGALAWGSQSGTVPDPGFWWWELRPHVSFGTLEVRVPDAQATVEDAAGVAAFVHCLVASLCERFDAGDRLAVDPSWRIEQNRWSAARHGVDGAMAALDSGAPVATRARIEALLSELERFDDDGVLKHARALLKEPGYARQRAAGDPRSVAAALTAAYPPAP